MEIPKIIHQTWKDENIPKSLKLLSNTWRRHHLDWEYKLWTDEMNQRFIEENFPSFIDKYNSYATNIQRVDAVRYFILYKYGGVFVDMDFECCKNIEILLDDSTCVFGKEPQEHCLIHNKELIISNAFMASIPNHRFFEMIHLELSEFNIDIVHPNDKVLETTGPFMITRVYCDFKDKEEVTILDSELIYPLVKSEISALLCENGQNYIVSNKKNKAYAVHYYYGTWWDNK